MYQQTGGVKIGRDISKCWNIGWPFARLAATTERLEIRVFVFGATKRYVFNRQEIVSLQLEKATFSRVVVIEHRDQKMPPFIGFEAFPARRLQSLLDELQKCGYSVVLEK